MTLWKCTRVTSPICLAFTKVKKISCSTRETNEVKNKFLNILYELSKSADIAVKTPVGITEEEELESDYRPKLIEEILRRENSLPKPKPDLCLAIEPGKL